MGMALRHALALLLVLLPLAVTTAYTTKQKAGGFGWDYCSSDKTIKQKVGGLGWDYYSSDKTIKQKVSGFVSDYCSSDNTIKHKDGGFRWDYYSSDKTIKQKLGGYSSYNLTHPIPKSDDDGMDALFSYAPRLDNFIALDMSGSCPAGSCDASENRRGLAYRRRYISYEALKKYRIPCNRRGKSYYNCKRGRQANPYRRGCSFITRCARIW